MFTRNQITAVLALAVFIFRVNGERKNETIYVLIWTIIDGPWWYYRDLDNENGYSAFVDRNCSFQNCYLTTNRTYFESVLGFDVLVFNAVHLSHGYDNAGLPPQRSPSQLYVLFCVEPAAYNSINNTYDGFFNLTWTYILSSDIVHPHFLIKNHINEIIGPKIDMNWLDVNDMSPTNSTIVQQLKRKSKAALWVVSNCAPRVRRSYVQNLNYELSKYGHRVDVYGKCGDASKCVIKNREKDGTLDEKCYSKIKSDYYFYLAFENSFTEDYVTEKILHALLHFTVPIVYGGANYTRFLPDGIYLDALKLGVEGLASKMSSIIKNPETYYDFFKWHDYYSYYDTHADNYSESVCAFCAFLNGRREINKSQVYKYITRWWNASYPDESSDPPSQTIIHHSMFIQNSVNENPIETTVTSQTHKIFSKIVDFVLGFLSSVFTIFSENY